MPQGADRDPDIEMSMDRTVDDRRRGFNEA